MLPTYSYNVSNVKGSVEIIPFFDVHIGDELCNTTLLKKWIEYVKKTPNAYAILGGDLINNSLKNSVGDIYSEEYDPTSQMAMIVEYFKPIKDKILIILEGNHEYRTTKDVGISPCMHIATALELKDRLCYTAGYLFLNTKIRGNSTGITYTVYTTHGNSGSTVIGGKATALEKMSKVCHADLYLVGHTHDVLTFKKNFIIPDPRFKKVKEVTRTFVNSNSFLSYGGYGAKKGYSPSTPKVPKIVFTVSRKSTQNGEEYIKNCEVTI